MLLKIARDRTSEMEEVKFLYADAHGNLKFILNTLVKNKYVIDFRQRYHKFDILTRTQH